MSRDELSPTVWFLFLIGVPHSITSTLLSLHTVDVVLPKLGVLTSNPARKVHGRHFVKTTLASRIIPSSKRYFFSSRSARLDVDATT